MKKLGCIFLLSFTSFCLQAQIPGDMLFNGNNIIHTVKFTFADTNWYTILVNNYTNGNLLDSNIYYSCNVEIDGTLMTNVGVKFKGNSSWNHPNGKKSMKISFAEYVPAQRYDSLKQLNLNNSYNDPTFLREKLYLDILRQNSIEGPRCQYASVYVNNQPYAFYTLVEEVDKTFLETHYGGNGGNLYKGDPKGDMKWEGWTQGSYYDNFELKTNEVANDWSDLLSLLNAINNTPALQWQDTAEKYINIHQFIKHYAAYIVFATLDSYVGSGHNFFIYYNKQTNQFEFIQWDTNGAFGRHKPQGQGLTDETFLNPFFQFVPLGSRPLTDKILSNAILKAEFVDAMCTMNQQFLNPTYLHHQIDSISNFIKSSVYADSRKQFTNAAFDSNLVYQVNVTPGLKNFSTKRFDFLKDTLAQYGCYPAALADISDDWFLSIYPNPVSNTLKVEASIPIESIRIYNVLGQVLQKFIFQKEKNISVSVAGFPKGLYFLEMNNTRTKKFFKE